MITGALTFEQAREALDQLYESSNEERRFILRLYVLYAFNDKYIRSGHQHSCKSEDYKYFVENCKEMLKMPQTIPTLRAELYREMGEFEQCIEYLDTLEPASERENKIREMIREKALNRNLFAFRY